MITMKQMQAAAKWDTGMAKPESKPPVRVQPVVTTPIQDTDKALNYYRSAFESKRPDFVPARVMLLRRVRADLPFLSGQGFYAGPGEADCESNQWGAISVLAANGKMIGVKPGEFEVLAWRANEEVQARGLSRPTT